MVLGWVSSTRDLKNIILVSEGHMQSLKAFPSLRSRRHPQFGGGIGHYQGPDVVMTAMAAHDSAQHR